jgi:hypothetical protein
MISKNLEATGYRPTAFDNLFYQTNMNTAITVLPIYIVIFQTVLMVISQ